MAFAKCKNCNKTDRFYTVAYAEICCDGWVIIFLVENAKGTIFSRKIREHALPKKMFENYTTSHTKNFLVFSNKF